MPSYDQCREKFTVFRQRYAAGADRNEAMTRLLAVDTIFFECLGWDKDTDVEVEQHLEGKYTDYVFRDKRGLMVVEAKQEGDTFQVPAGLQEVERSLKILLSDEPSLKAACKQAMGYATERGIPIAVTCNGHQLVAFVATRQDGVRPLEGKALVFGSLEQMEDEFLQLWQALSKPAICEGRLISRLTKNLADLIPSPLSARITPYPGTKGRNPHQTNLKILSELVLEDLMKEPEHEEQFLRQCYCKSGSLSQDSLESKRILIQRYALLTDEGNPGPAAMPAVQKSGKPSDLLGEGIGRRPILLLGDVGVGKTSFIRNLIKVEAKEFFSSALPIYLDLGSKATLTEKLQEVVIREFAEQLKDTHGFNINKHEFVQAVYEKDLKEWEEGIDAAIKESDPALYGRRRHEFLVKETSNKSNHLKRSAQYIIKKKKKPIILFLDNLDQREGDIQQQAFLIAHEISESWEVTVFVTLRPETFHQSRRDGVLSGYHPKAFTVAPPRVDLVIEKRLNYAIKITSGEFHVGALGSAAEVESLRHILTAFKQTIGTSGNGIIPCLDNLSGGDVRVALNLLKDFFGSGHVDTRKIVEKQRDGGYIVPPHELHRAIIYGDAVHYDPRRSLLIANLFQLSSADPRDHFLSPILVAGIASLKNPKSEGGFVLVEDTYRLAQGLGFVPSQIRAALSLCLNKKLIQTNAGLAVGNAEYVRTTTIGLYHLQALIRAFSYIDAIIVDTPILDVDARLKIRDVSRLDERLTRAKVFVDYLAEMWQRGRLPSVPFDWKPVETELRRAMALIERAGQANAEEGIGTR